MEFTYIAQPKVNHTAPSVQRVTPTGYISAVAYLQNNGRLGSWMQVDNELADEDATLFDTEEEALSVLID
jgi:hypothetical protein